MRHTLSTHNTGTRIGNYTVEEIIGYGGYGAVYRAKDTRTGREVALKESFNPDHIRAFEDEFTVLQKLNRSFLPKYYEMFENDGNGYLVMEFIPGKNLAGVLKENSGKPNPVGQVMGYAYQLCDVLTYLHQQNPPLIHRDIKPAYVRITPDGLIKLVDFGLLKQGTDTTEIFRMGLPPPYAPLEQWGDTGEHTIPQSDIYSLGATLYHLLTGQIPPTARERNNTNPGLTQAPS
jgi:serine/threonine-protein kinase